MNVLAYLRHPLFLLVAVSAVIALTWYALGLPVEMPRSPFAPGDRLHCLSYDPLSPQAIARGESVSPETIDIDLARLAPLASCIRTYRTGGGLDHLADIAARHGLWVWQGIAIGRDTARNDEEIERAIALAPTHRDVIRAFVVGSEVLSSRDMPSNELAALIRRVKGWTGMPVTYADRWDIWLDAESLAAAVDFIMVHVELYQAYFPVAASEANREMVGARARVAVRFPGKKVVVGEAGWPSAGRMRESALPSPANQARVLHEFATAAKAGDFELNLFEGIDQPWRRQEREDVAGSHWGLVDADSRTVKFVWGRAVSNHPLWFTQGSLGVMLAFVVFAAAYAAARSFGLSAPRRANWWPVALVALAAGLPVGWAVAEIPLQSASGLDWLYSVVAIGAAFVIPPIAAAALILRTPVEGFAIPLNERFRKAVGPLGLAVAAGFILTVVLSLQQALGLVFDPGHRGFPFAPLTGPIAALLILALRNPAGSPHDGVAETLAATALAGAAVFIAINETLWNWQAQWFALLLLALAWACRRVRAGQIPG